MSASVSSFLQCSGFGLWQDAPRAAVGVYHLSLPVLVMIGILLLSFVVVRVVVPVGQRFGFSFNELGRSRNQLRKVIDPMLKEMFHKPVAQVTEAPSADVFSWTDFERLGALDNLTTAQLQQAAEKPDGFLRKAAAGSRELLLSACAARIPSCTRRPRHNRFTKSWRRPPTAELDLLAELSKLCHSVLQSLRRRICDSS